MPRNRVCSRRRALTLAAEGLGGKRGGAALFRRAAVRQLITQMAVFAPGKKAGGWPFLVASGKDKFTRFLLALGALLYGHRDGAGKILRRCVQARSRDGIAAARQSRFPEC